MGELAVSVVVPTRNRADYLEVALRSLAEQEGGVPYEVVVVDDHSSDATPEVAARAGVRRVEPASSGGLNAARNAGVDATSGPLVAFVDDDIWAPPGWVRALAAGAGAHPGAHAFGGPIRARLEGPAPRGCGRESAPITTLDLGTEDRDAAMVWGANLAVRRSAFESFGRFDDAVGGHGDIDLVSLGLLFRLGRAPAPAPAPAPRAQSAAPPPVVVPVVETERYACRAGVCG